VHISESSEERGPAERRGRTGKRPWRRKLSAVSSMRPPQTWAVRG